MHNTHQTKKSGITLAGITFREAYGKIRGAALPQGAAFRDKRNDYKRNPKHKGAAGED